MTNKAMIDDWCQAVLQQDKVLPTGGGTKPALRAAEGVSTVQLDTRSLSGVLAYDPSEFLITAASGTPLSELQAVLGEHQQYLPFDPLFVNEQSTLGGTVASGLSGPRSLLYGTLRDFVMEVEFIDGLGKLVRGGGKVVKNAAGFDFPKLMVGSYGRLGILTEVTLKVLPVPIATRTLFQSCASFSQAIAAAQTLLAQPLPIAAVEIGPDFGLRVEFAGLQASMDKVQHRVQELLSGELERRDAQPLWSEELQVSGDELLVRIAFPPGKSLELAEGLAGLDGSRLVSLAPAGGVAWVKADGLQSLGDMELVLQGLGASAVVVRGHVTELTLLGKTGWVGLASRIQLAIDPHGKFLPFELSAQRNAVNG
ncbi:MAG: FAD-binding protein [bacterium]|nr:FAD-binding protein [bacterium]